jgi:hypothetical protein
MKRPPPPYFETTDGVIIHPSVTKLVLQEGLCPHCHFPQGPDFQCDQCGYDTKWLYDTYFPPKKGHRKTNAK